VKLIKILGMPFLFALFIVALSFFVMVLVLLVVAAIGGSIGGPRNLKKIGPERRRRQPRQSQRPFTANLILLDSILAQYGPEARTPFAHQLWREKQTRVRGPLEVNAAAERVYLEIHGLSPQNDLQRALQSRAAQLTNDIAQTRFLLFVESDNLVPAPFLAILAFWLVIIFASFSLFSPLNATVFTCLSLFALSAACAIFLILELSQPFTGLLAISSTPLRNALGPL